MSVKYLEDFEVGQSFGSGRLVVDAERIRRFAAEFDPQPFHLDEEAAQRLHFPWPRCKRVAHSSDQGLIKVRTTTLNQDNHAVQILIANLVVQRRPL